RNYDIFRRFAGRSSLRTYLVVVGTRLLLDWRVERYGKWRPSATAQRLGRPATALERLLRRDGYGLDAAIELARLHHPSLTEGEARAIAEQLPARARPQMVAETHGYALCALDDEDPVDAQERQAARTHLMAKLSRAMRSLAPDEQFLIVQRYLRGRSVQALA